MPRKNSGQGAPSAANKYAKSLTGAQNGQQLQVPDVTDQAALWALVVDCILHEVPVTLGRTRDGTAITVAFYAAGDRHTWYLVNHADWEVMISELES